MPDLIEDPAFSWILGGTGLTEDSRGGSKGIRIVKFSSHEEFELHVHKCFDKIFELLMKVDAEVKREAEKEETQGNYGVMSDVRDWIEEIILHCHLAWQYHRLSKGSTGMNTWDALKEQDSSEGRHE